MRIASVLARSRSTNFWILPVAFVALKTGANPDADALIAHARSLLAHFKAPKRVVFGELPKNATGKIQKFILRERAKTS